MENDEIKWKHRNHVTVSWCPICGRELFWTTIDPTRYPEADYVAVCVVCRREFGVSIKK